jgi:hypothetical protein
MSFGIYLADQRQFHFRPDPDYERIRVYDRWNERDRILVAALATSEEVWSFFAGLTATGG